MSDSISILGRTNARAPYRTFGIKQDDRLFHVYVIGRTGTGKSTLLESLALQDIRAGRGLCFIDPHGEIAPRLVAALPPQRRDDLRYLNVPDSAQPYGYNPLRRVQPALIPLAVSGLMETMRKHWGEAAWGVRMEHILRNALYALIEVGDATMPDILRMFTDKAYRASVVGRITNEQVLAFWKDEFPKYHPRYRQEMLAPIQNKVAAFLADPKLRRIFTDAPIALRFRPLMDESRILIVNLAKGTLGEDSAGILGAMLVSTLGLAALSRDTSQPPRPFFLYIDEFQSFTTAAMANMISELRKFGLGLTVAHQHLFQLTPEVRHAVLGNAGTIVSFRIGPEDASLISKEFEPVFSSYDLVNLPNHDIYLKLMINGTPSRGFSGGTLGPGTSRTQ